MVNSPQTVISFFFVLFFISLYNPEGRFLFAALTELLYSEDCFTLITGRESKQLSLTLTLTSLCEEKEREKRKKNKKQIPPQIRTRKVTNHCHGSLVDTVPNFSPIALSGPD